LVEPYNSHLPSVTDFQLNFAIDEALTKPHTWSKGIERVYYTIAQDYLYENPMLNVTFLDNHDKTRFFSTIGEDVDKFKSGIAFLLTMRGIPSLYYGTELLYAGISNPDGKVRQDFQGGWKEDEFNKFTNSGRTAAENDAFEYVKKLANYRKNTPALHSGKLTHFIPVDGIYVYFRYDDEKTIMVIMNTNPVAKKVSIDRFAECLSGFSKGKNIISDEVFTILQPTIVVNKNSTLVLELMD